MGQLTKQQIKAAKEAWHDAAMKSGALILTPDEIIDAITPHVQYAPTEPGAPAAPQTDEELIDKMRKAFNSAPSLETAMFYALAAVRAHDSQRIAILNEALTKETASRTEASRMLLAACTERDELRARVGQQFTAEQVRDAVIFAANQDSLLPSDAKLIADGTLARLASITKTPEERVTIEKHGHNTVSVFVDGILDASFSIEQAAEAYRIGRIAQLKEASR